MLICSSWSRTWASISWVVESPAPVIVSIKRIRKGWFVSWICLCTGRIRVSVCWSCAFYIFSLYRPMLRARLLNTKVSSCTLSYSGNGSPLLGLVPIMKSSSLVFCTNLSDPSHVYASFTSVANLVASISVVLSACSNSVRTDSRLLFCMFALMMGCVPKLLPTSSRICSTDEVVWMMWV